MCQRQKETKRDGDSFVSSWASPQLTFTLFLVCHGLGSMVASSSWKQQALGELLAVKRVVDTQNTQKLSPYLPDSSQDKNMDDKQYEHQVLEFNTEYYTAYQYIILHQTPRKSILLH
ncbi:unnamed protein product, partial [Bubo scandiacus]